MSSILGRPTRLAVAFGGVLVAALCFWLSAAVMPALADGGPHVSGINSGSATMTADTCAACHRAHSGQGAMLLTSDEATFCVSCHGQTGQGATTNVEGGVQYAAANTGSGTGAMAGALRSGGFVKAAIDSGHSSRISYPWFTSANGGGYQTGFSSLVKVLSSGGVITPAAVTSAHLDLDGTGGVVAKDVAWGNGATGSGAGPTVEIGCTSCHNPHGNGNYRILNKIPSATGAAFAETPVNKTVADASVPVGAGAAGIRNYTVQWGRTLAQVLAGTYNDGTVATMPDQTAGDYWRKYLPWDGVPTWDPIDEMDIPATGAAGDQPMYVPGGSNLTSFNSQIASWCAACHSRYFSSNGAVSPSADSVFTYRHISNGAPACTQCHVSHGSNAAMAAPYSGPMTYPNGAAASSTTVGSTTTYYNSRLLKIDNRGTCQACHDPTHSIPYTTPTTITH